MILVFNILFILLLLWWMSGNNAPFGKVWCWVAVSLKLIAGITLGYIYSIYLQSGDTLQYFDEASSIANYTDTSVKAYLDRLFFNEYPAYKGEARTEFFAKLLSIFLILTSSNYWLCTIYFSIFSFLGCWYLARTLANTDKAFKWPAFLGLMIVPSFVFWSSGILKDSLSIACLCVLSAFIFNLYHRKPVALFIHIFNAILLIILIKLRFYLGAYMLFALGWVILEVFVINYIPRTSLKWTIRLVSVSILILAVSYLDYNLQLEHLPASITHNYQTIVNASQGNHFTFNLESDWKSIFISAPKSLFFGLFGPLPGQGPMSNLVYWIENSLLTLLVAFSAYLMISKKVRTPRFNHLTLLLFGFIFLMATLLPLAAPNFGTLMRYKAAFLPFLWIIASYLPILYYVREKSV